MSELYNRIEALCKERKITVSDMCRETSISRTVMSELKHGRTTSLSAKNLDKIATYFGVTSSYLLGTEIKKEPVGISDRLNEYEREFLEVARRLSPENQAKLLELAKLYLMDQEAKNG